MSSPPHHDAAAAIHHDIIDNNKNEMTAAAATWTEVRKEFREAVTAALENLLERGFSRERATAQVLHHLGGGHEKKPSDNEVSRIKRTTRSRMRRNAVLDGIILHLFSRFSTAAGLLHCSSRRSNFALA